MKESYRKGPASRPDPESCEAGRKVRREALTRADAGEVSSREIPQSGTPMLLSEAEGNMTANAQASSPTVPRGRRPSARIETSYTGTGRPHAPPRGDVSSERPNKAK